jgi:putative transposase
MSISLLRRVIWPRRSGFSNLSLRERLKIIDYLEEQKRESLLAQLHFYREEHKKDREYQLWQEGSHPEVIVSERILEQKLLYMHYNPVRRGYVENPEDWRYSSARNYAGMEGLLQMKWIGR